MKAIAVVLALCTLARADDRGARIAELFDALRGTDPATLATTRKYLQNVERNKCQAPEMSLRVGCMLEAAEQNCKSLAGIARERCRNTSDVIATNLLSERVFVPDDVRYEILSRPGDPRVGIARELDRRYALLVTELALSTHFPGPRADTRTLAGGIDQFCTDVAGTRDLSWQYCVAAILWFVAEDGVR